MSQSIRKTTSETYDIRNGHESATIVLREWERPTPGQTYQCGEILIRSTFGNWANTWGACGCRFKKFIIGCDFDYTFSKLLGRALDEYDGDATLREIKRRVILDRCRYGNLSKENARAFWDAIVDNSGGITTSLEEMVHAMATITNELGASADWMQEPWYLAQERPIPQAVGFWEQIWPTFKEQIKRELATEAVTA